MVLLSSAHGFVVVLVLRLMVLWLYCTHGAFTATLYTQFQLYGCMIILYSWFSAMLYSWFYSCVIYSRFDGNVILIDAKVYYVILMVLWSICIHGFIVSLHSRFHGSVVLMVFRLWFYGYVILTVFLFLWSCSPLHCCTNLKTGGLRM